MIPNVVIGERLGGGGFGDVYRGFHAVLTVPVAVKIVSRELGSASGEEALNEAGLMARLDHPNLLRIFDAGRTPEGRLYLVLELMDGHCAGLHRIAPAEAGDVLRQLLAGLQALHAARVLHRDIKPANILRRQRDARIKLADLGIAIAHATVPDVGVQLAGTTPFMAPELFRGGGFSPRTDLYAVGVTMQCLVLDRNPFPSAPTAAMAWAMNGPASRVAAQRPDLPAPLARLIDDLSSRDGGLRPASASDALARLSPTSALVPTLGATAPTLPRLGDAMVGAWVLGAEVPRDGNFREFVVSHGATGAAGRLALLKPRCPLQDASPLIVASAQRAARLQHPGIVDVVDWGIHDERAFVVTRPQGRSLMEIVEASRPLDELEAVGIARSIADALAYVHAAGLVYQVVHPGLIVIAADGRTAQLAWPRFCLPTGTDLASADARLAIAVPRFAAPESLARPPRGGDAPPLLADPTFDLYGLGETLFYLLAGRPAYSGTTNMTALVLEKMRHPARIRDAVPAVTGPTAQLIADLTAPLAADRPRTAAAVRDELDRIAERLA